MKILTPMLGLTADILQIRPEKNLEVTVMPNNHDIFRNKRDFARAEFATELYKPPGKPRAREAHTQKHQHPPHNAGFKNIKVPFQQKAGLPGNRA